MDSIAQGYPAKPIRVVVGYSPGGATDFAARWIAQKLSEQSGQSAVVENRAGASGTIATERVAASPPDGYTLLVMTASDTVQPAPHAKLPYDIERDFTPVSLVCVDILLDLAVSVRTQLPQTIQSGLSIGGAAPLACGSDASPGAPAAASETMNLATSPCSDAFRTLETRKPSQSALQ